jgi:hypothetical protein
MLGATTLEARIRPLRSRMRPRLAGSSSVRAKRTWPWRWKKSLLMTWMYAARPASPTKPMAIAATTNLLRHTGVLLAKSGLEVYMTLRLIARLPRLRHRQRPCRFLHLWPAVPQLRQRRCHTPRTA